MPQDHKCVLCKLEENQREPREEQGLDDLQMHWAEEGGAPFSSSSSSSYSSSSPSVVFSEASDEEAGGENPGIPMSPYSPCSSSDSGTDSPWSQLDEGSANSQDEGDADSGQEAGPAAVQEAEAAAAQVPLNPPLQVIQVPMCQPLHARMSALITFLLLKYRRREFTSQAEIVREVLDNQLDQLPIILVQARECLRLVFGIEMWEVNSLVHSYVMTPTLGLTYDGLTEAENSKPKTGLLILILGIILRGGDRASEEIVWQTLGMMGVLDDRDQSVFGESREFLINEWVQEQYLVCQQVPDSHPPKYEFLWGPRAYAETSKVQVLELWLQVINRHQRFPLSLCA